MRRALLAPWRWLDDRLGFTSTILPVIVHPVPKTNWWYVLGSATLAAFVVQVITGVALAFTYVPAPNSAYESLQFITNQAALGSVVRGIHYWGASAMVILIGIHAARTFLMGSYKFPRELNWLSGVFLLLLTLAMAFTGQLLRWNQDAYWAVVVGAAQAVRAPLIGDFLSQVIIAGQTVGGPTLTRFYATHVFLLPAAMFGLIGLHLYLVVRHGISELPAKRPVIHRATYRQEYDDLLRREGIPFWPDAAWKDVVFALLVGSVVLALAIIAGPPPLGERADPTNLQAYPRPDWYFLWYFALLALVPPAAEDWFIIGFPLVVGVVFLALPIVFPTGERRPSKRPWAVAFVGLSVLSILTLVRLGAQAPWSPVLESAAAQAQVAGATTDRGAALFVSKGCSGCHAIGGAGGQRGPNLTAVGARLSPGQLTTRILAGGNNMPAYGSILNADEVDGLVRYLQTRRGGS